MTSAVFAFDYLPPPFLGSMSLTRADIHKGALGLEQIAACFHELAGAADTIVSAQRKLSRALKEGASSKGCPEVASQSYSPIPVSMSL